MPTARGMRRCAAEARRWAAELRDAEISKIAARLAAELDDLALSVEVGERQLA